MPAAKYRVWRKGAGKDNLCPETSTVLLIFTNSVYDKCILKFHPVSVKPALVALWCSCQYELIYRGHTHSTRMASHADHTWIFARQCIDRCTTNHHAPAIYFADPFSQSQQRALFKAWYPSYSLARVCKNVLNLVALLHS